VKVVIHCLLSTQVLTNSEYDDDTTQIPRSTTVIARRLPAARQGNGRAARYVTGKMPVMAKNQHRIESTAVASAKSTPVANGISLGGKELTEEEKMNAMFAANSEAWKADQAQMANKPVVRGNYKSTAVPDKPLPPSYICHRCGEKGHWIQACPTNNDPNFDGRPKFRRTTGIPRSMLKVVEKPTEVGEDGKIDISKLPPGVMYTANGEWVIAEPDNAAWDKYQEKQNASAEKAQQAAAGDEELRERGLECSIDKRMFVDPVKTPCCGKTYCRDCVENALLDGDLLCPNCGEQVLLDKLERDDEAMDNIKQYESDRKAEKQKKEAEIAKSPANAALVNGTSPSAPDAKSPPETKVDGAASASSTPNSKKRPANEELENTRKPANPAETKKTGPNHASKPSQTPIPTGPKASSTPQPAMQFPNNMHEFAQQMQSMAPGMSNMQHGMPAMMNPMGMGMGMPPMGMGPMGMPMMPNMNPAMMGFGMNGGMHGTYGGGGAGMMGNNAGWQGSQGWGNNGMGMPNGGGGNDGAYFRQGPQRQQGRQRRQRSVDYKQMGS